MSSKSITVSNGAVHLMQCLDYFESRSVIGTLNATEDRQRSFFKDEFELDMNSDLSISMTEHGTTIYAVFQRGHRPIVICLSL